MTRQGGRRSELSCAGVKARIANPEASDSAELHTIQSLVHPCNFSATCTSNRVTDKICIHSANHQANHNIINNQTSATQKVIKLTIPKVCILEVCAVN
jgi:hypothetical protein